MDTGLQHRGDGPATTCRAEDWYLTPKPETLNPIPKP